MSGRRSEELPELAAHSSLWSCLARATGKTQFCFICFMSFPSCGRLLQTGLHDNGKLQDDKAPNHELAEAFPCIMWCYPRVEQLKSLSLGAGRQNYRLTNLDCFFFESISQPKIWAFQILSCKIKTVIKSSTWEGPRTCLLFFPDEIGLPLSSFVGK